MSSGVLLSVAGFDPTSGAGVTLDLKVFASQGFQGMGLATAVTVQNTQEVKGHHCLPSELVQRQYRALKEDADIRGIKVGMLGCREHFSTLEAVLEPGEALPAVVDPVLRSSSGAWLLEPDAVAAYMETLSGRISLLTPNLAEASMISGSDVSSLEDMREAAQQIYQEYRFPTLIKGGHLTGDPVDVLFDGRSHHLFSKERTRGRVHGTGCFLSASILCLLVQGCSLNEACRHAGERTLEAIRGAVPVGKGRRIIWVE
jgi:hydroxymethylpyrimidine/phosphomethylpyrimidine kinase